jgi:hypothetical protein
MAHACNPSYSGGRDQENHSLKPAWANSPQEPILKKTIRKKCWRRRRRRRRKRKRGRRGRRNENHFKALESE